MGVGQVLSNRTELKIPYSPSLSWYRMVLGAEPFSSAGRGGGGAAQAAHEGLELWQAQQGDKLLKKEGCPFLSYEVASLLL